MEKNMIWQKPEDIKVEPDKEYLLRLPGCCVVAKWSKGNAYNDEAGRFHWRNGRLWYPDALVLAVMEIPDCPFDGKICGSI